MQTEDGSHRPYRVFSYQSNCSEASSSSAASSWGHERAREQCGLELRRPLRQAKIVFAEHFSQQEGADELSGQPGCTSLGHMEADAFHAFLAREQKRERSEVVAMPYENISALRDDDVSESGGQTLGARNSLGVRNQELRRLPAWVRWVLTVAIAVVVAIQCSCMLLAEIHFTGLKLHLVRLLYWKGFPLASLGLLLGYGLLATFLSALLVLYVSPRAASSGIPDTKAYLNGHHLPGFLSFKAWFARTFALILVTSAGLFAGSEGPLVAHLGAIISSGVARGRLRIFGKRFRMPWRLTGHRSQCEFVSIGTAMGVSAAFGSPVGGVLFSLEEVSSFWSNELTWRAFFGSAIAALLAKGMKNGFGRKFLNSSFVEFPDVDADFQTWELIFFVLIGVATGTLGALFCRGSHMIGRFRAKVFTKEKPHRRLRVLEVMLLALAILLTCSLLPMVAGCSRLDSSEIVRRAAGSWHVGSQARGHCQTDEYSDMATLLMQPKHVAIKALFTKQFEGGANFGLVALGSCCLIIFVFTLSANGMAMPYGLFVPHIMLGGCCGRAIGQVVQELTGDQAVHPGVYALVGSAGQLAGISRMTVSLTMIMVEITSNMRLMLPLMLSVMVSKFLADQTGPSVFDVALELNNQLQMLSGEWQESDCWSDDITVLDICSIEVIVLHCKERVSHIVKLLAQTDFHAFPLVEGQKAHVVGIIQRSRLVSAISKDTPTGSKAMIDLLPYANLTPEVKHWKTPVARVFTHFKSMGLSHLCVVDNHHGLMGIVTRTDMAQLANAKGRRRLYEKLVKTVQLEQEKQAKEVVSVSPRKSVEVPSLGQLVDKVQSNSTKRSKECSSESSSRSNSPPQTERSDASPRSESASGSPRLSHRAGSRNSFHSGVSGNGEVRGLAAEILKAKEREIAALRSENEALRTRLKRLTGENVATGDEGTIAFESHDGTPEGDAQISSNGGLPNADPATPEGEAADMHVADAAGISICLTAADGNAATDVTQDATTEKPCELDTDHVSLGMQQELDRPEAQSPTQYLSNGTCAATPPSAQSSTALPESHSLHEENEGVLQPESHQHGAAESTPGHDTAANPPPSATHSASPDGSPDVTDLSIEAPAPIATEQEVQPESGDAGHATSSVRRPFKVAQNIVKSQTACLAADEPEKGFAEPDMMYS